MTQQFKRIAGPVDVSDECAPTFMLDRLIAEARREMGEARWQQLQAEWNAPARTALEQSNVE